MFSVDLPGPDRAPTLYIQVDPANRAIGIRLRRRLGRRQAIVLIEGFECNDRRRLVRISKQGNVLPRFLVVEAAQVTVRSQPEWRSKFFHLAMRRGRKIATVAMARKLAVHLYSMCRQGCDYGQLQKFGSHVGVPGNPDGVQ